MAIMDTIRALLAKAESTNFPEERQAYLDKAQELQTKYAIDEATLNAADPNRQREHISGIYLCTERNTPLIKAKRQLVTWLADINNCFVVIGPGRSHLHVTGHDSDLQMVNHMFTSVLLQMQTDMQAAERRGEAVGGVAGWRVSYAHAYVGRVAARLYEAKKRQQMASYTPGHPGTSLVLADRKALAKQAYETENGKTKAARRIPTSDRNGYGRYAGDRDGRQADLGGQRVGNTNRGEIGS